MWVVAGIYFLVGLGIVATVNSPIISLIWLLLWPCIANYLYYKKALTGAYRAIKKPDTEENYLRQGGVSKAAVWVGIGVTITLSMMAGNYVSRQFLEKYGEDLADVLPGSGSQVNRDGTILDVATSKSETAKTSLTLSTLATSLKILIVTEESTLDSSEVQGFLDSVNEGKFEDGWGQKIRVIEEVDRYVLYSAGPDTSYQTDDDILQPVNIR